VHGLEEEGRVDLGRISTDPGAANQRSISSVQAR